LRGDLFQRSRFLALIEAFAEFRLDLSVCNKS